MEKKWYQKGMDWLLEKENAGKKWYKRRIVWVAVIIVVLLIVLFNSAGGKEGNKKLGKYEIPNVFGVYYEDAVDVLEAEGFEVKTIEADAKSTFHNLYSDANADLRPQYLEKGAVFKIDDYTQRGDGCLIRNDDIMWDGIFSDDKSLVIYYAKETYSGEDNTSTGTSTADEITEETSTETTTIEDEPTTADITTKEPEKKETNNGGIRAEFKAAMDSYEKFFDEYVAIMKKYKNNPGDMSILADYSRYMGQYAQMMKDFEKWESEDMNTAEAAYYLDVQNRITKKLLEVAQ